MLNIQTLVKPKFKLNGLGGCMPINRMGKYKDYGRRLKYQVYEIIINPTGLKATTTPKPMVYHKKVAPESRSLLHPYSIEVYVTKERRGQYKFYYHNAYVFFGADGMSGRECGTRVRYAEGEEIDANKRLY